MIKASLKKERPKEILNFFDCNNQITELTNITVCSVTRGLDIKAA